MISLIYYFNTINECKTFELRYVNLNLLMIILTVMPVRYKHFKETYQ